MGIICTTTPTVVVNNVTLPEVTSVTWSGLGRDAVDVTSFDSAGWRQYVSGVKEPGTLEIECFYIPDNAEQKYAPGGALYGFYAAEAVTIEVSWPNAAGSTTKWTANGFLTAATPTASAPGEALKLSLTYKLTGAVTLA